MPLEALGARPRRPTACLGGCPRRPGGIRHPASRPLEALGGTARSAAGRSAPPRLGLRHQVGWAPYSNRSDSFLGLLALPPPYRHRPRADEVAGGCPISQSLCAYMCNGDNTDRRRTKMGKISSSVRTFHSTESARTRSARRASGTPAGSTKSSETTSCSGLARPRRLSAPRHCCWVGAATSSSLPGGHPAAASGRTGSTGCWSTRFLQPQNLRTATTPPT